MRKITLLALASAIHLFCSLAFAQVDGVPAPERRNGQDQTHVGAAPETAPVKIVIPSEVLEGLGENRTLVEALVHTLENRLYKWTHFPIELPETVFTADAEQIVTINNLFQTPNVTADDELRTIGDQELKFSPEQREQIHQKALIIIPSQKLPGQSHVFQLSWWLQKGADNIQVTFDREKDFALRQITVQIPERLWGDQPLSVKRGALNLIEGLKETLGLFVGWSANDPEYSEAQVDQLIIKARAKAGEAADPRWLENEKIRARMEKIQEAATRKFQKDATLLRASLQVGFTARGMTEDEIALATHLEMEKARQENFYEFLAADEGLNRLSPGLGQRLARRGRAIELIAAREAAFNQELAANTASLRPWLVEQIRTANPIRSRSETWLNRRIERGLTEYYRHRSKSFYDELPAVLAHEGYAEEAEGLRHEIEFLRHDAPEAREKLEAKTTPSRTFTFYNRLPRREWRTEALPGGGYRLINFTRHEVDTSESGWRIALFFQRWHTWSNQGYYFLLDNFWNGPLGIRSLISIKPFQTDWRANPKTGEIEPTGTPTGTLASRIQNVWETRQEVLKQHSQSRNRFFSKKVQRRMDYIPVDLGLGVAVPTLVAGLQVAGTAVNSVASLGLGLTSWAWAPVAGLLRMGFDAIIYDKSRSGPHGGDFFDSPISPLVHRLVLQATLGGAVNMAAGVAGVGVHAVTAPAVYLAGAAQKGIRTGWDATTRNLIIYPFAHVPGGDSRLYVKRIKGPGLASDYFFQVPPALALLSLQAQMEKQALTRYSKRINERLLMPLENAKEVDRAYRLVLGGNSTDLTAPAYREISKDTAAREKEISAQTNPRMSLYLRLTEVGPRGKIRLPQEVLNPTLDAATEMTHRFYQRVFTTMTPAEVAEFWRSNQVARDDWAALAKSHLAAVFGDGIVEPLEVTDQSFEIEVEVSDRLIEYAEGLVANVDPRELDRPTPIIRPVTDEEIGRKRAVVLPQVFSVDAARLCEGYLGRKTALGREAE